MGAPSLRELLHPDLRQRSETWRGAAATATATWSLTNLAGRFVELSARGPAARLTCAAQLVLEAQLAREPAAWVTSAASSFHPPDLAHNGVDLGALTVVRIPAVQTEKAHALLRAAETLLRAGAFGLVVVDLDSRKDRGDAVTLAAQTRLVGLAQHHNTLLLCLSGGDVAPHALASLRAEASLLPQRDGRFTSHLAVVKDKRAGPGWHHAVACRGAHGMELLRCAPAAQR